MLNTGTLKVTTPSPARDHDDPSLRCTDGTRLRGHDHDPSSLKRWFGPHGWNLVVCEVDFRVGGAWRYRVGRARRSQDGHGRRVSRDRARRAHRAHRSVRRLPGRLRRHHRAHRARRQDHHDRHSAVRIAGDPRQQSSNPGWSTAPPRPTTGSPTCCPRSPSARRPIRSAMARPYARAMAQSPIFEFADRFVDEQSALDPCLATARGIPGFDDQLTDYSPQGTKHEPHHMRLAVAELSNSRRRPTTTIVSPRTSSSSDSRQSLLSHDTGEWQRALRAITAPTIDASQHVRPDGPRRRTGVEQHRRPAARDPCGPGRSAGDVRRRSRRRQRGSPATGGGSRRRSAPHGPTNRWFDTLAHRGRRAATMCSADVARANRRRVPTWPTRRTATSRRTCAPSTHPTPPKRTAAARSAIGSVCGRCWAPTSIRDEMYEWAWTDFHHLREEIARNLCADPARGRASPR